MANRGMWALALVTALGASACSSAPDESSEEDALRLCLGSASSPWGVDVSRHQGTIDWGAVHSAGASFGFARVSDGTRVKDATFSRNWEGLNRNGMRRGAYQFFRPGQDAIKQADDLIATMGQLGAGDLPPVLDLEVSDGQSDATIIRKANVWLQRVKAATGRTPIVYTSPGFFNALSGASGLKAYPLWVANYGVKCPSMPQAWATWTFWQRTDRGKVPGIKGFVDANRFSGSAEALDALASNTTHTGGGVEGDPVVAMDWTRGPTTRAGSPGCYRFHAHAPEGVERVEYWADDTVRLGAADRAADFALQYCFKFDGSKPLEAHGFDAAGRRRGFGAGSIDVTSGMAIYVREVEDRTFEVGLERPTSSVAAISVTDGATTLTDSVSGDVRSARKAVRAKIGAPGEHTLTVRTFTSSARALSTFHRTITVR